MHATKLTTHKFDFLLMERDEMLRMLLASSLERIEVAD